MTDNRKRMLIIEDDPGIAAALKKDYLEIGNFEVVIERNGRKGMERALKEQFALILLNFTLPGKDAVTICRDIGDLAVVIRLPVETGEA